MLSQEIRRIMKENEKYANMLEEYDRTGEFPLDKVRRSFTLKRMTVNKLKTISEKTGKSMSGIIDNIVDKCLKE
jgi:hypothetical protein